MPHSAAFESGARRARGADEAPSVSDDDLGVGADVDEKRDTGLGREIRRHEIGSDVRADVAADDWRAIDAALGVDKQTQLMGPDQQGSRGSPALADSGFAQRSKGRATERAHVETKEEIAHRGVAHHDGLADLVPIDAESQVDRLELTVQGAPQGPPQFARTLGVVPDAAHDIAAPEALRVLEGSDRH